MTSVDFGDVVLVPFPFTDQTTVKRRPAVIVSSTSYHRTRRDLLILAVTSRSVAAAEDVEVAVSRWREAGLLKPSVLKPVIATIARTLVVRRLGRLVARDRNALRELLEAMIGSP